MKKISLVVVMLMVSLTIFMSCSSDSTTSSQGSQEVADLQNATEDDKVSVTALEEGIVIEGASKKTGTPPAPNGTLDFQIATNTQVAIQQLGFNIEFSSTDNVAGAYIQFKDVDGNLVNGYVDVPVSAFGARSSNKSAKKQLFKSFVSKNIANKIGDDEIDVNLSDVVPAGQFCYDICLYDSANNVSSIETVCVTIEAWGGNAQVVGNWSLENQEGSFDGYDEIEVQCDNGATFKAPGINTISSNITVRFNEDGTYEDSVNEEYSFIDYEESSKNCSAVYGASEKESYKSTGNWAYNEDDNTITIVVFKFQDLLNPDFSEEFDFGEVAIDGLKVITVTADDLVIGQEFSGDSIKYFFKRK